MLAGLKMETPKFSAYVDRVDGSKSVPAGFTPGFENVFDVKAEISATAALSLPLSIGFGIRIPPIKFDKTVSVNDKPDIAAILSYSTSTPCEPLGYDNACLNGITYDSYGRF